MLHAFEKMDVQGERVVSRRKGAALRVDLACSHGLSLSRTDRFDTPYNQSIPEAYRRERANHWHVTAETVKKSKTAHIAAVMAVSQEKEKLDVELQRERGWFGAKASGDFGRVEGWIRLGNGNDRPTSVKNENATLPIDVWGRDRDGIVFYA